MKNILFFFGILFSLNLSAQTTVSTAEWRRVASFSGTNGDGYVNIVDGSDTLRFYISTNPSEYNTTKRRVYIRGVKNYVNTKIEDIRTLRGGTSSPIYVDVFLKPGTFSTSIEAGEAPSTFASSQFTTATIPANYDKPHVYDVEGMEFVEYFYNTFPNGSHAGSSTDELQDLSLVGNNLSISGGVGVDLLKYLDNTDEQTLSHTSGTPTTLFGITNTTHTFSISGGNSIDVTISDNDRQNLALSDGDVLTLTNSSGINLSKYRQSLSYDETTDSLKISGVEGGVVISGGTEFNDLGDISFVSINGNDTTGQVGYITSPYRFPWSEKTAENIFIYDGEYSVTGDVSDRSQSIAGVGGKRSITAQIGVVIDRNNEDGSAVAIFDDGNVATDLNIDFRGSIKKSYGQEGFLKMENPESNVNAYFRDIRQDELPTTNTFVRDMIFYGRDSDIKVDNWESSASQGMVYINNPVDSSSHFMDVEKFVFSPYETQSLNAGNNIIAWMYGNTSSLVMNNHTYNWNYKDIQVRSGARDFQSFYTFWVGNGIGSRAKYNNLNFNLNIGNIEFPDSVPTTGNRISIYGGLGYNYNGSTNLIVETIGQLTNGSTNYKIENAYNPYGNNFLYHTSTMINSTTNIDFGTVVNGGNILNLYGNLTNSTMRIHCDYCQVEEGAVIHIDPSVLDSDSEIIISGYWETLDEGFPAIIIGDDFDGRIILENLTAINKGTTPSVQALSPTDVYANDLKSTGGLDSDINYITDEIGIYAEVSNTPVFGQPANGKKVGVDSNGFLYYPDANGNWGYVPYMINHRLEADNNTFGSPVQIGQGETMRIVGDGECVSTDTDVDNQVKISFDESEIDAEEIDYSGLNTYSTNAAAWTGEGSSVGQPYKLSTTVNSESVTILAFTRDPNAASN